ncbi:MAG TPA: hypothetical protein VKB47_02730 [Terracidiphilus sp.]|nr:hypothetical protein [Terracidiphilus sp.]
MKPWKIVVIPTAIMLVIASIYTYSVWKKRQNLAVAGQEQKVTIDDVAIVRMEFPQHFDDVKDLAGKSVWMKNGYTMPYFPYAAGRVDFKRRAGLIPPLQKLNVKKVIKKAAPTDVDDGISHGYQQALVVFTLPGDEKQEFATPVGAIDEGQEQYYDDMLFFYDDPRTIYSHWPSDVWAAINAHQAKQGMNELQTRLALGQKIQTDNPQSEGNRTVTYDANGKKWTVTFHGDKATEIRQS